MKKALSLFIVLAFVLCGSVIFAGAEQNVDFLAPKDKIVDQTLQDLLDEGNLDARVKLLVWFSDCNTDEERDAFASLDDEGKIQYHLDHNRALFEEISAFCDAELIDSAIIEHLIIDVPVSAIEKIAELPTVGYIQFYDDTNSKKLSYSAKQLIKTADPNALVDIWLWGNYGFSESERGGDTDAESMFYTEKNQETFDAIARIADVTALYLSRFSSLILVNIPVSQIERLVELDEVVSIDYPGVNTSDELIGEVGLEDEIMVGDADADGAVTILDVTRIQRYCAELVGEIDVEGADVDGDGEVSVFDATVIQKQLAGMA